MQLTYYQRLFGISFKTINLPFARAISATISSTSKRYVNSLSFSINLAIGLSGFVAARSSILLGPLLKEWLLPRLPLQIYMRERQEFSKTPFEISKSQQQFLCVLFFSFISLSIL
jgi:hypothetical protein